MPVTSRRTFLAQAAALVCASETGLAKDSLTRKNLGVELYTVRNIIVKDPATVLESIHNIGYTEVEATYASLNQIWSALKNTSLRPVAVHVDKTTVGGDPKDLDAAMDDIKQRDFEYVVLASFPTADGGADAAGPAKVRQYFVEQDQTLSDPISSLRQSYSYLQSRLKS